MIFQDEVSRVKKNILCIGIANNPASGFYFENRIARSPFVRCHSGHALG